MRRVSLKIIEYVDLYGRNSIARVHVELFERIISVKKIFKMVNKITESITM